MEIRSRVDQDLVPVESRDGLSGIIQQRDSSVLSSIWKQLFGAIDLGEVRSKIRYMWRGFYLHMQEEEAASLTSHWMVSYDTDTDEDPTLPLVYLLTSV